MANRAGTGLSPQADVRGAARRAAHSPAIRQSGVNGFLLEWRHGSDNRWKGLVNYRWKAGRKVALKDQSQLRPDKRIAELFRAGAPDAGDDLVASASVSRIR